MIGRELLGHWTDLPDGPDLHHGQFLLDTLEVKLQHYVLLGRKTQMRRTRGYGQEAFAKGSDLVLTQLPEKDSFP